jgi:DNA-binding NtrC family response regulator
METANVLICEADPDVRRLLAVLVGRMGHTVVVPGPDVAVPPRADLMLLEPESPACLEHARAARAGSPDLPVVSLNLVPAGGEFLFEGPIEYLQKPFTVEQLRAVVQRTLGS